MKILGIETSGDVGSVALGGLSGPTREERLGERGRHGEALGPASEGLLRQAGWGPEDLDAVAVGLGPGSYTGVRIGVTFAKTLAWLLEIPLVGLPGLMAVARDAAGDASTVAVLEKGHRTRVYGAVYDVSGLLPIPVKPVDLWSREVLLRGLPAGTVLVGSEAGAPRRVSAATLVELAVARLAAGASPDDPLTLAPLYLQPPAPER